MASVEEHYKNLLAPYYTWISGGADQQLDVNRSFFRKHKVLPSSGAQALDLGAGSGFQSIPLAELGFQVHAIDLSSALLRELKARAGDLPIVTIQDNLLNFARHIPSQFEIIVCMGDTLTHLNNLGEVQLVIRRVHKALAPQGRWVIGFRDLSVELSGLDRFIPVRSESHRIFTCFLEFKKKYVRVHDLLYERTTDSWTLHSSFFHKLRISAQWLQTALMKAGFRIDKLDIQMGMTMISAHKPKQP